MAAEAQLTPMMTQYRRIKGELPKDALLLFRPGDFYEIFFEDAQTVAQILNSAPQPPVFARSVAESEDCRAVAERRRAMSAKITETLRASTRQASLILGFRILCFGSRVLPDA